ncbi:MULTISPECIES: PASTA domain-containing protein [unclassified Streptomyces]|uniref:PASTA domain-containing protein n=1 Tax=unclassified Streptomyces TaxID=2593676 RepID=UPI00081EE9C6|nr:MULTISPECIES: PASTA domain-containing protein [unclassified Streptomyces]SCD27636.1 PASTA domain-containing protein [Streptomyces sp. ScaeMP-e83]
MVRIPRRLAPLTLVGVLALAGCSDGTPADDDTPATAPATVATSTAPATAAPTATASAAPTDAPTPTPPPAPTPDPIVSDPVMPALHSKTYEQARAEFTRRGLSPARLTAAAQHKDVTLSRDHGSWYICDTSPRPGDPLPAATTVTVRLAKDFSDCTTSFHGYLYEKNDPASTP